MPNARESDESDGEEAIAGKKTSHEHASQGQSSQQSAGRRPARARKRVERLHMVDWERAKQRRNTGTRSARVVHVERMGAGSGELRHLIRIGPALVARIEGRVEDGDKENG